MTRFQSALVAAAALLAGGLPALAGPLHEAVKTGDIDQVKQAIAEGADVNQGDFAFGTPLHLAANKGHAAIAALLIEKGADVSMKDLLIGFTPLHAAAFAGHIDVVEILVAQDGDANARDNNHTTPIHHAAASAHFDVVEFLIAHGASAPPVEPVSELLSAADPDLGELLYYNSCRGCHVTLRIGPHLRSVIGRKKASVEGFGYSPAFARLAGTWTYEELNAFIASPRDFVPGTIMAFPGIKDVASRANLIAYLRENSDNPLPLPAQ